MCYLPARGAKGEQPALRALMAREAGRLQRLSLTYVTAKGTDGGEQEALQRGEEPSFAGHQTMEERSKSFEVAREMRVHCG